MATPVFKRLPILAFLSIWALQVVIPGAVASYNIGVGRADVTGPVAGIPFLGNGLSEQKGAGIHLRMFSRAFIIDDGEERFVFVSVDSAMTGNGVRQSVLQNLQAEFGDLYTEQNVMISSTHTLSTPGGYLLDLLYDISTSGYVKESFDAMINGITRSIELAHQSLVPGKILIAKGEIPDVTINRSPSAYHRNPKAERNQYQYDVDKTLTQMQFVGADDTPLGAINWFAVQPASMGSTNKLVSSDNVGYASVLFEQALSNDTLVGKGPFVAAFASTNLGDVSPNTAGAKCEISGQQCSDQSGCSTQNDKCIAAGPGKDMFDSTSIVANKIFQQSLNLWQAQTAQEVTGPLQVVHRYVNMPEQTAPYKDPATGNTVTVSGCEAAMGYNVAAGTIDGPGSLSLKDEAIIKNTKNVYEATDADNQNCHSPKSILLPTGRMNSPYEWQPKIVSTQVALIGNVVIAGVPGEFTTMAGRRLRSAIRSVLKGSPNANATVVVAGLCNTYSDYVTTPEEYQAQLYEGASTIYGPHTLTIYLKQYKELVSAALLKKSVESGPLPTDLRKANLLTTVAPVFYDTPEVGQQFGDCVQQPQESAKPGDSVTAVFVAGHPRNNLMTDSSFLTIEKLGDDKSWSAIAVDADWSTQYDWERTSEILRSSRATVTWQVPSDAQAATYRIRHNGYYSHVLGGVYSYFGLSNQFQVAA